MPLRGILSVILRDLCKNDKNKYLPEIKYYTFIVLYLVF